MEKKKGEIDMLESKIAEMLGQLSDKLGVASSKIWEWSLLQVKVEVVTNIVIAIVAIVASILSYKIVKRYLEWRKVKKKAREWDDTDDIFPSILGITAIVFLVSFDLYAISGLIDLPKLLINPEYAAFENIVKQLGSLK